MSSLSLAVLGLLACGGQPAPDEAAAPPDRPAASSQVVPDSDAWSAANIQDLQPVAPSHTSKVPVAIEPTPQLEAVLRTLGAVVDARATDPATPWAIGHGMVARGKDLTLSNGQPAVDWLFAQYAEPLEAQGTTLVQFPDKKLELRVEPHADLMLKAMTEVGVDPAHTVTVAGQPHPVADLWRGALLRTHLVPARNHSRYASPDDIAWSLQGMSAWAPPGLSWVALDGTPMNMDDLTDYAAAVLYSETRVLARSLETGQPFQRQGQGIFRYTCGGAHLLQGVSTAVMRGFGTDQARQVVDEQVALQFHRFPIEVAIYHQALTAYPEHAEKLQVQRLKFAGHFVESMSKLAAMGVYSPDAEQLAVLVSASDEIVDATARIEQLGLLSTLDVVRARDEQLYLDIVGDSAHGIRGLELALGRSELRW